MSDFNVITRSGKVEPVQFDAISRRNEELVKQLGVSLNVAKLTQLVTQGLTNNITTEEIDNMSSETAISLSVYEPEYDRLAARIFMDNLHKRTPSTFSQSMEQLKQLIHPDVWDYFMAHRDALDAAIIHERDFQYQYFACKTLERGYLLKDKKGKVIERPQYMLMRVSIGIHY